MDNGVVASRAQRKPRTRSQDVYIDHKAISAALRPPTRKAARAMSPEALRDHAYKQLTALAQFHSELGHRSHIDFHGPTARLHTYLRFPSNSGSEYARENGEKLRVFDLANVEAAPERRGGFKWFIDILEQWADSNAVDAVVVESIHNVHLRDFLVTRGYTETDHSRRNRESHERLEEAAEAGELDGRLRFYLAFTKAMSSMHGTGEYCGTFVRFNPSSCIRLRRDDEIDLL